MKKHIIGLESIRVCSTNDLMIEKVQVGNDQEMAQKD